MWSPARGLAFPCFGYPERCMSWFERSLMNTCNLWFAALPQAKPSRQALLDCKIISHRGEHDNRRVRENTLAAFAAPAEAGCWGLEFDVRWTRDQHPVVVHDADARRVFGQDLVFADLELAELRRLLPDVPSLREVVDRFGGRQHLMVELKQDDRDDSELRAQRLRDAFQSIEPVKDYHILALQPELFELVEFAGKAAWLPVAQMNVATMSRYAESSQCAGLCAQYLLLNRTLIARHRQQGQSVGSGFAASKNGLCRELNRGVDWIFTNHALRLETIRQQLLRSA